MTGAVGAQRSQHVRVLSFWCSSCMSAVTRKVTMALRFPAAPSSAGRVPSVESRHDPRSRSSAAMFSIPTSSGNSIAACSPDGPSVGAARFITMRPSATRPPPAPRSTTHVVPASTVGRSRSCASRRKKIQRRTGQGHLCASAAGSRCARPTSETRPRFECRPRRTRCAGAEIFLSREG